MERPDGISLNAPVCAQAILEGGEWSRSNQAEGAHSDKVHK